MTTHVSHEAAAEALDSMDDYARMSTGVDAHGPRGVLERYIAQQAATLRQSADSGQVGDELKLPDPEKMCAMWTTPTTPHAESIAFLAGARQMRAALEAALAAQGRGENAHPDDAAVEAFAGAMKAKLAEARAKGRGGWQDKDDFTQQRLSDMLRAHVAKGDPRDVANFCMFLHQRGEAILLASPAGVPDGYVLVPREPTEAMRAAFRADRESLMFFTHTTLQCADFDSRYRAMLAAAPAAPEGGEVGL